MSWLSPDSCLRGCAVQASIAANTFVVSGPSQTMSTSLPLASAPYLSLSLCSRMPSGNIKWCEGCIHRHPPVLTGIACVERLLIFTLAVFRNASCAPLDEPEHCGDGCCSLSVGTHPDMHSLRHVSAV